MKRLVACLGALFVPASAPTNVAHAQLNEADFDPAALVQEGADPMEVFLKSPVAPKWSGPVQAGLSRILGDDLKRMVPGLKSFELKCRLLGCLAKVSGNEAQLQSAQDVLGFITFGPVTVAGVTSTNDAQMLFLTASRFSDPKVFLDWYRGSRRHSLDAIRAGKKPNTLPVHASKLPSH